MRGSRWWWCCQCSACACWTSPIQQPQVSSELNLQCKAVRWDSPVFGLALLERYQSATLLPDSPVYACPVGSHHAVLSEPVVMAWPDGRPRSTYHDVKWNEAVGLLYAVGKDKLVDLYALA